MSKVLMFNKVGDDKDVFIPIERDLFESIMARHGMRVRQGLAVLDLDDIFDMYIESFDNSKRWVYKPIVWEAMRKGTNWKLPSSTLAAYEVKGKLYIRKSIAAVFSIGLDTKGVVYYE